MSGTYEVVRYDPQFRDELLELQQHLWGPDCSRNAAYFEWKYEKNPFVREPLIYLARVGGRIVGMRGFFGARWEGGGETVLGLYADDTVIAPEFQGHGVFVAIMDVALAELAGQGHEYVINLSAGIKTFVASLASGWKSLGPMRPVARVGPRSVARRLVHAVARPFPVVRQLLWAWAVPLFRGLSRRSDPFRALDGAGGDGPVRVERTPRPLEMADLIERLGHDGRIRHVRDAEYLTWRFQNPFHEYRFLFLEGRRGLEGYLVLQRRIGGPARLQIVDWEVSDVGVREALLTATGALGQDHPLFTWTATLPYEACEALRQAGFIAVDPETTARGYPSVLVRSLRRHHPATAWAVGDRPLVDLSNWDLRLLYSMLG